MTISDAQIRRAYEQRGECWCSGACKEPGGACPVDRWVAMSFEQFVPAYIADREATARIWGVPAEGPEYLDHSGTGNIRMVTMAKKAVP